MFSIGFVPIDPDALPDDAAVLQEIVRTLLLEHGELHAEKDKLRLLVQKVRAPPVRTPVGAAEPGSAQRKRGVAAVLSFAV